MQIEINDEWIKLVLNASPDTTVENALRYYMRTRERSYNEIFVHMLGKYTLHEMAKKI